MADASYNIAPRQRAPVVRRDQETGEAMIETM
jgi:putative SOS response-associated peptidase YedK